ncbi:hypothetical protein ES703_18573 [subsurface metagenome]
MENELEQVIGELLKHEEDINSFFNAWLFEPFGIKKGEVTRENFRKIFLFCVTKRGFPKSPQAYNRSIKEFDAKIDEIIKNMANLTKGNSKEKFDYLFKTICNIHLVGPKIASLFLELVVLHGKVWEELIGELYVPIDRHVRTILIEKLRSVNANDIPEINKPKTKTWWSGFYRFQKSLTEVHAPRIHFDYLWFIGHVFCGGRIYCDLCWIKNFCKDKEVLHGAAGI